MINAPHLRKIAQRIDGPLQCVNVCLHANRKNNARPSSFGTVTLAAVNALEKPLADVAILGIETNADAYLSKNALQRGRSAH